MTLPAPTIPTHLGGKDKFPPRVPGRPYGVRNEAQRIAGQVEAIREGRVVTKLSAIGERIAAKKKAHDAKAEEWAKRLDALDTLEPRAFAIGDAAVAEREGDIKQFESDMKALSNLPLLDSAASSSGSAAMPPAAQLPAAKPQESKGNG